ncbi:MAG: type II toxin-antitoxin system VapB family antitoxin [Thermodesulfobacteriota bacterium]
MRMSVALDRELLEEAQSVLGKKTKREVIEEALRELVRKKRREEAIEHAGKIDMDIDLEGLMKIREKG